VIRSSPRVIRRARRARSGPPRCPGQLGEHLIIGDVVGQPVRREHLPSSSSCIITEKKVVKEILSTSVFPHGYHPARCGLLCSEDVPWQTTCPRRRKRCRLTARGQVCA